MLKTFCRMVKIEHSVFALPFALIGLFLAAGGWPGWYKLFLVVLAMVAIRSFAMGMNRILDRGIDARNQRTRDRPLVTGEISAAGAWGLTLCLGAIFLLACAGLNQTCLLLAPLALIWAGLYSYSKRFTWLCHYWLGSVLGLAPVGGWLAFEPKLTLPALLFFFGVLFWVAGFDILYSCQDQEFDRSQGLKSAPACLGLAHSLRLSTVSHLLASLFFLLAGWAASLGALYFVLWFLVCALLLFEHRLVSVDDMSRVNLAFFTINGVVAVVLCLGVLTDLLLA